MITYMSWIQTTADWLDITYFQSLGVYVGIAFLTLAWCYCCCYVPLERCCSCICYIPKCICGATFNCCKRCIMSEPVDAAFRKSNKNTYKLVQTIDIFDDESERGPMV